MAKTAGETEGVERSSAASLLPLTREEYLARVERCFREAQDVAEQIAVLGKMPGRTTKLRRAHKQARALLKRMEQKGLISYEEAKGLWDRESVPDPKWGKLRYTQPFADDYEDAKGPKLERETGEKAAGEM